MVERCRNGSLDVVEADAIEYLRTLPDASLGGVTGMHIIEHVPFSRLIDLFDETLRALKPGGVAIFETPNPENLRVGACNFYFDPTHIRPLPPESTRFFVQARGFGRVDILRLHPDLPPGRTREIDEAQLQRAARDEDRDSQGEMVGDDEDRLHARISEALLGPQDYAIVAYRTRPEAQ